MAGTVGYIHKPVDLADYYSLTDPGGIFLRFQNKTQPLDRQKETPQTPTPALNIDSLSSEKEDKEPYPKRLMVADNLTMRNQLFAKPPKLVKPAHQSLSAYRAAEAGLTRSAPGPALRA